MPSPRPGSQPPIIVANRAPVELDDDGTVRKAAGGLVSALNELAIGQAPPWIGLARTEAERRLARSGRLLEADGRQVRFVDLPAEAFALHYAHFANPVLWFLHHGMPAEVPSEYFGRRLETAWSLGYQRANTALAEAVVQTARSEAAPTVLIQDYQLMLVPGRLRDALPASRLSHFIHIPWPEPELWSALPAGVRTSLLRSLLASDVVGFQTRGDAERFLGTVERWLAGEPVPRRAAVVVNPISVDVRALRRAAAEDRVQGLRREMAARRPDHLILRVDRSDPTKNVPRGFDAYARLLELHPELRGRVEFWAFVQPSRTEIPLYRRHLDSIRIAAGRLNARFGGGGWTPLTLREHDDRDQALAAYGLYDTLFVNPVADGMNLVAKEGPVLNQRNGALVLSRRAGACEQLGEWALAVDPLDLEDTSEALYRSITMHPGERRRRASGLRMAVELDDLHHWARRLLGDLVAVPSGARVAAG